jgi:hypothetical protein
MKNGLSMDDIEEKLDAIKFEGENDLVNLINKNNKKKTKSMDESAKEDKDSETESESGRKLLVAKSGSSSSR